MERKTEITLKDVSKAAKVSIATVSRVLNGSQTAIPVSEKTKKLVFKTATELGYRPNASARAIRSGQFRSIATLISSEKDRGSVFFHGLLEGIYDELNKNNLNMTISRMSDKELTNHAGFPKILRENMIDGLIVNYSVNYPSELESILERFGIPSIWLNVKKDYDCVYPDEFTAGYDAARSLAAKGHDRISYLNFSPAGHYSSEDRENGCLAAMNDFGMEKRSLWQRRLLNTKERLELAKKCLSERNASTGFIADSETAALTLLFVAGQLNIDASKDISILAFGEAHRNELPIDTLSIKWSELGKRAVKMLLRKMGKPEKRMPSCPIKLELNKSKYYES